MKIDFKKEYKRYKILIRILIIFLAMWFIYLEDYRNVGTLAITMIVTFYDSLAEKILKIELDNKLKIFIITFIFLAQCLGSVLDFYGKFYWWDTVLHTMSGILFFIIGLFIIDQINKRTTNVKISKSIIIIFAICFSLAIALFWEVFEFGVDTFLGGNMQVSKGLVGQEAIKDTMIDIISAIIGTTIGSIYVYIKTKMHKNELQVNNKK